MSTNAVNNAVPGHKLSFQQAVEKNPRQARFHYEVLRRNHLMLAELKRWTLWLKGLLPKITDPNGKREAQELVTKYERIIKHNEKLLTEEFEKIESYLNPNDIRPRPLVLHYQPRSQILRDVEREAARAEAAAKAEAAAAAAAAAAAKTEE